MHAVSPQTRPREDARRWIWLNRFLVCQYLLFSSPILFLPHVTPLPVLPPTSHLDPFWSAEKSRYKLFTSLADSQPSLRGQPVRVYHPVELNSLSNRTSDSYVLWLFQPLPANYLADQSAAQPESFFYSLGLFATQPCRSDTDAVGGQDAAPL